MNNLLEISCEAVLYNQETKSDFRPLYTTKRAPSTLKPTLVPPTEGPGEVDLRIVEYMLDSETVT